MPCTLIVRIDSETKRRLDWLARREGKTAGRFVRELLESYVRGKKIGTPLDDLWERIDAELRSKRAKGAKRSKPRSVARPSKR
jgi:predicted DNA-binding protein